VRQRAWFVASIGLMLVGAVLVGAAILSNDNRRVSAGVVSSAPAECDTHGAPDYLVRSAFGSASQSDPRPKTAEFVKTTRAAAASVASDPNAIVPMDEPAYLLQIAGGGFDVPRGPPGAPAHKVAVLSLTISIAQQFPIGAGYSDTAADLSKLGAVTSFSLDPSCVSSPRTN